MLINPGYESGPQWAPSAYSPRTGMTYIAAGGYDPWVYHAIEPVISSLGSTGQHEIPGLNGVETYGLIDAVDTTTGKIAWQIKTPQKTVSGMVAAGDLVFYGEGNGRFNAADANTGQVLWSYKSLLKGVGGANGSAAVYAVNGREYIVMPFGGNDPPRIGGFSDAGRTGCRTSHRAWQRCRRRSSRFQLCRPLTIGARRLARCGDARQRYLFRVHRSYRTRRV